MAMDGEVLRRMEGSSTAAICCLAMSPSGSQLASGDGHGVVKLWAYDEGMCQQTGLRHSGKVTCLAYAPDGNSLVSGDSKGALVIWPLVCAEGDRLG